MPRYARAQLRWSEQAQHYVLITDTQVGEQVLTSDWLEQNSSFAFHSCSGVHYTVRKQRAQRGGHYWYAYRRLNGRVVKRYLGKAEHLTLARLEDIARLLQSDVEANRDSSQSSQEAMLPVSVPAGFHAQGAHHPAFLASPALLLSKLSPPRLPAVLVDRPRLLTLLDAGREGTLTLVSAPAGFGKTTLVRQWMAAHGAGDDFPSVAWLSLEAADNDRLRFWRYLIAACQAFQIDLTPVHDALAATTPQPPFLPADLSTVLAALLNALAQSPTGGVLVLEDFHVLTDQAIHETVLFFLNHLPATFHLILIARTDPPFALARLRARHALCEVRAADLRFSCEETAILLHHALPFEPPTATLQRVQDLLEGWGAGLHLLALALRRASTPAQQEQVLARFSGNTASLHDYVVTEVLDLQPEGVQHFLLRTSLLDRLTASLCDAVTEQHNGQDVLSLLEHLQLFLEPLDPAAHRLPEYSQQWYRYQALFAEAMRHEARRRLGDDHIRRLAAQASAWHEAHGSLPEAIEVALSGQDYTRAARLIERTLQQQPFPSELHEPHTLRRWFAQLPEPLLHQRPILCLRYATVLLFQNTSWQPEAQALALLEGLLRIAEERFRAESNLPQLGELFAFRALLALRQGAMQAANEYARQALANGLGRMQPIWRAIALSIMAEEQFEKGRFREAHAAFREALALCEAAKNHYFQQVAKAKLAQVCYELGAGQQAAALYRQVLAEAREGGPIFARCLALVGLAALCYEADDLEGASQHAHEAVRLSQSHHLISYEAQATIILARVDQTRRQALVAQQDLAALLDRVPRSMADIAREIQTAQARVALSIDDHLTVQRWATQRFAQQHFSQEREEELLLARWLRAQNKPEEAARLLQRALVASEGAGHTRRVLEIQVEMALVAARNDKAEAQRLLRDVLTPSLNTDARRLFLDGGEQMANLLRSLLPQLPDRASQMYVRALLRAFPVHRHDDSGLPAALPEPLSPQELRVLRLLVQHRSNAEIASELVVSVNTVRTQVQSIFRKLGVSKRSAAGEVARELRLIA